MKFDSRETYLAAVAVWKQQYKQISQNIRDARSYFKDCQRARSKFNPNDWSSQSKDVRDRWYVALRTQLEAQLNLNGLRREAANLLAERAESKVTAAEQMRSQRAA